MGRWFQIFRISPVKSNILNVIAQDNAFLSHATITQWAVSHIEQQFKYNILLKKDKSWNFVNTPLNQEYEIPTLVDDGEIPVEIQAVRKLRISKDEFQRFQQGQCWFSDYLIQQKNPLSEVTYWFHGTDHDSAKKICEEGIDIETGKRAMDFSDGAGFYLTR